MSQVQGGPGDGTEPVGTVYEYGDGLRVRVDDVMPYELVDAEDSYGYRQGDDLVRCTLYLHNGTGNALDLDGVGLLVRGGPFGKTARQVQDYKSEALDDELDGTVRAGRAVTATWAYSIPAGTAGELDIEVRFRGSHDRESVTFTTVRGATSSGRENGISHGGVDDYRIAAPAAAPVPASAPVAVPAHATAGPLTPEQEDAERVKQIFRFLASAEETRTRPVRTLDGAAGVIWFDELPDDHRVSVMLDGPVSAEEPAWFTVGRPDREEPPQPGEPLSRWIDEGLVRDFTRTGAPELRRRTDVLMADWDRGVPLEKDFLELDDHPERERIEERYAVWEQEWLSWAGRRRADDPVIRLYDRLHRIHEQAAGLGESYELVLGFGRLVWQTDGGQRVERHLATHRATVRLDHSTGALTVLPDPTGNGLTLEEGMLEAAQHVTGEVRESIVATLESAGDLTDPENLAQLHQALRSWVNATHSAGTYLEGVDRVRPRVLDAPHVGLAPALVLRERNRRSTLDALNAIAAQVEGGTPPTELLSFIAGRGGALTAADLAEREGGDAATGPREMYFALPANEEQRTIAERLRSNRLVVVQGPPGTGKTHTIANLVTDLLAQGQRVLITSHTPRALRVLRDKLPESVRDLCVSRTEDGAAAQRELAASVQRILSEYGGFSKSASDREIAKLRSRLDGARATQRTLLRDLADLRELETRRFDAEIGDYRGSLQEIAGRLTAEADRFDWLGEVPGEQPALTAAEALRLLRATRAYTPHHRALAAEVPGPADLPPPSVFEEAVGVVGEAEEAHRAVLQDTFSSRYDAAVRTGLGEPEQRRLLEALGEFASARARAGSLAGAAGAWAATLLEEVTAGQDWQARSRKRSVQEALKGIKEALAALGTTLVSGLEQYDPATALAQATTLCDGLAQGQRLRGPLGMKSKLAKAVGGFAGSVRVDGRAPEDAATAGLVLARTRLELRLGQVEAEWGAASAPWQPHTARVAALEQQEAVLDALLAVADARTEVLAAAATSPELAVAVWHDPQVEGAVRALLRAATTLRAAEASRRLLVETEEFLGAWADRPGVSTSVRRALEAVRARNTDGYREFSQEMTEVREAVRLRAEQHAALTAVREAFPALADRITADAADPAWDARLPELAEAWAWSAWRARMERLTDPAAERGLRKRLTEADDEIRIVLARLAAARAWARCLEQLTGDQSRALKAYQQAAGRIKGKYQHRYRRDAQAALREAQTAVPAWIMPLHQVAETVPMDRPGMFDVVIVDEASQSGLEAMLLSWVAGRMVVVGDSKQVSPSNVGLKHEEYFQLQRRLLTRLPDSVRSLFGPESSFFDLTESLSSGSGTLMLKEHFRCMPEIISFSNELCYNRQLQPLRQYGAERLNPVRTVLVEDGEAYGTGARLVNPNEARALVDAVAECCADPAYEGRTMGVVTLRSSKAHREELENLLAERIGYDERVRRRIRVGDAEDFQGDERHVLFVSCVNSPTTAAGTVAGGFNGKAYEQRLNVAASRAQDQLWVFHSARAEQFHANDLRRRWLDHLTRPAEEETAAVEGEVLPDVRHEAFDSLFQQEVYLELTARRYRVRPRYRVGRHTLDLVVEGGTRRLAVACDGDTFGEGEDASTAAARQRDLERVDWRFVRIRASRFRFDREQALAPLWAELERLGIEPMPEEEPPSVGGPSVTGAAPGAGDVTQLPPGAEADAVPAAGGVAAENADPLPPEGEQGGRLPAFPGDSPIVAEGPYKALPEPAGLGRPATTGAGTAGRVGAGGRADESAVRAGSVSGGTPVHGVRSAVEDRTGSGPRAATASGSRTAAVPERTVPEQRTGPAAARPPVREIPQLAFINVLAEMTAMEAEVKAGHEVPEGLGAVERASLLRVQAEARERYGKRLAFLRAFIDSVDSVDTDESQVVVPGTALVLEFDGEKDEDTVYAVAEWFAGEVELISPSSPLGAALMWQPVGREIAYSVGGKLRTVVIRGIRV
ncbi:AAA domain-containing protein [Streptomyces sp. MJP52]|uniref:AAA domain-containing protein n=1 Tax=Streptomyces sp. MJP52 TaxID=2940555 RepID=UPI002473C717|nr:AAA domain-containing protein [Streptomyces sp. MJP52]MDH6228175.1 transcription elongation GreA/GreB family factor [Streptomyces sp. MJP52]